MHQVPMDPPVEELKILLRNNLLCQKPQILNPKPQNSAQNHRIFPKFVLICFSRFCNRSRTARHRMRQPPRRTPLRNPPRGVVAARGQAGRLSRLKKNKIHENHQNCCEIHEFCSNFRF